MDDNQEYNPNDVNQETDQQISDLTNKAGNVVSDFGRGLYQGGKQVLNSGLSSGNKTKLTDGGPEIPTPNKTNPTGTPPQGSGMPSGTNKDKKSDLDKKDGLKKKDKKDKKNKGKDQDKKKKPLSSIIGGNNDKNKENSLGSGIKKLFGKDKKQDGAAATGLKEKWKALLPEEKVTVVITSVVVILFSSLIAVLSFTAISTATLHSILEPFVCSMIDPLPEGSYTLKSDYGWRVIEKEVTYVLNDTIDKTIISSDFALDSNIIPIYEVIDEDNPGDYIKEPITESIVPGGSGTIDYNSEEETSKTHKTKFHEGIDLSAPEGTRVYAVQAGTIEKVGENNIYGKYIIIDHNKNGNYQNSNTKYKTIYAHLGTILIQEGDLVVKESPIGRLGPTASYSDSYLHFEVVENDKPLNLNKYFGYDNSENSECMNESVNLIVKRVEQFKCDEEPETIDRETGILSYCGAMCTGSLPAITYSNATNISYYNIVNTSKYQCVWYAIGRANEILELSNSGKQWTRTANANGFCDLGEQQGFTVSYDINSPQPGAIIVWNMSNSPGGGSNGEPGHVAIIESIEGDTISYSDSWYSLSGNVNLGTLIGNGAINTYNNNYSETYGSYYGFKCYVYLTDCEETDTSSYPSETMLINQKDMLPTGFQPTISNNYGIAKFTSTVYTAYMDMKNACEKAGMGDKLDTLSNSYRAATGVSINPSGNADGWFNKAGQYMSEHHAGLAIDFELSNAGFGSSNTYKWLKENAYKYGFIERYTEANKYYTNYAREAWHWRYIGTEHATKYKEGNYTSYEQYYCENIDDTKISCDSSKYCVSNNFPMQCANGSVSWKWTKK